MGAVESYLKYKYIYEECKQVFRFVISQAVLFITLSMSPYYQNDAPEFFYTSFLFATIYSMSHAYKQATDHCNVVRNQHLCLVEQKHWLTQPTISAARADTQNVVFSDSVISIFRLHLTV